MATGDHTERALPEIEIPNFRLIQHLGDGGMGSVFLGEQRSPKREVAIKVVMPDPNVPPALMEMLKQEGDVAAQFQHPNLVTVYECGIVDQHYYIAMEMLPGGDLYQHNTSKGIDPLVAGDWVRQIAGALAQIHERGFVHRDIKPANILFSPDDRPILTDFGIAKVIGPEGLLTQMGYTTGTPAYMSPEQIQGKELDGRSDLYSLGVVLYELLTGTRPFEAANDFEIREMQVRSPVPPLPSHLVAWQSVIHRMLAKLPDDRYGDAREAAAAIEEACAEDRHNQPATVLTPAPSPALPETDIQDRPTRPRQPRRPRWLLPGIGVLAVLAVAAGWWSLRSADPEAIVPEVPTVAVLPFVNMSADPDNEYFSDGIAEEILNTLIQIEGLKVAARTASFQYRDHTGDTAEVGRALKVNHILEGSVRRAGNQVRITAQLVNVGEGYNVWSSTYDRTLDNIFALQTEIATDIAKALEIQLAGRRGGDLSVPTDDPVAYELYLRGRHLWRQRNGPALEEAVTLLRRAVDLDPTFSDAMSTLALALYILPSYAGGSESDNVPEVERFAEAALQLDPANARAHTVLGKVREGRGEFAASEIRYLKAIEADPDLAGAHHWYAIMLHHVGRLAEGRREIQRAYELDPSNGSIAVWFAISYLVAGEFQQCVEMVDEATRIGFQFGYMVGPHCHIGLGQLQEAERERSEGLARLGIDVDYVHLIYEALDDPRRMPRALEALQSIERFAFLDGVYLVESFVLIGAYEAALEFAFQVDGDFRDESMNVIWSPLYHEFRQTPQFREYARRMLLVDYWQESGWPDLCRPTEQDFECD